MEKHYLNHENQKENLYTFENLEKDFGYKKMSDITVVFIMLGFGLLGVAIDFLVWYYYYSVSLLYVKYVEMSAPGGAPDLDSEPFIKK